MATDTGTQTVPGMGWRWEYDGIYREQGFFGGRNTGGCVPEAGLYGEAWAFLSAGTKEGSFYTGQLWEIGLKGFDFPEKVELIIHPPRQKYACLH